MNNHPKSPIYFHDHGYHDMDIIRIMDDNGFPGFPINHDNLTSGMTRDSGIPVMDCENP